MQALPPVNTPPSMPSGILVVDDHDLVRLGLRTLVQSQAASCGCSVEVFEARTLSDALALYQQQQSAIGLVLLDLHLPDAHGMSGLVSFMGRFPAAPVVVLSGVSDPALVIEARRSGAKAYLAKSGDLEDVVRYIRSLGLFDQSRSMPVSGDIGQAEWRVVRTLAGDSLRLTNRQAQVLDAILIGQSNREIAELAHLSEGTVKNHVSTLLLLFGVRSRSQLISQLR
jgi:DNA-binding NarL/FixJ family response regulator